MTKTLTAAAFVALVSAAATLSQDKAASVRASLVQPGEEKFLANVRQLTFGGQNAEAYWSADGRQIIFQSNDRGSLPCDQIFVMNADGSSQRRITTRGNYNQTPAWRPRIPCANKSAGCDDAPLIAFTARDEKYAYDIFTVNADTGEIVRITEGHGSNQRPTWAPNGRAIAYESSRGGIWISTADGRTERQVYKGSAAAPAWGPHGR